MAFGDFTVTRASTKNVLGSAGLYVSVANNTPALEFNTDGSYRGTLVEPGATNLATYSQAFGDASWDKANVTVSSDTTVAPDGTTTADSVLSNTVANNEHRARKVFTMAINTAHTASIYVKKAGGVYAYIRDLTNNEHSIFDLDLVNVLSTGAGQVSTIEPIGDYYRITTSFTTPGVIATNAVDFGFTTSSTLVGSVVPVGEGLIMWQAQLETGPVATSYIVTTGSTASRVADVASLTGASSLIGATEGTLYAEAIPRGITSAQVRPLVEIDNGDIGDDGTVIRIVEAGNFQLVSRVSTATVSITSAGLNTNVLFKFAGAYKTDDFIAYVNGSSIGSVVSGGVFGGNTIIRIGGDTDNSAFNGWIRSVALFPTRLANATLASLTTP
jgi:hypothetical protein